MLAKNDPLFPYKVKELSFVFLDKDRDFKEESFAIASEDVLAMEKRVVKAYETITQLSEFKHTYANFSDGCEICAAFPEGLV